MEIQGLEDRSVFKLINEPDIPSDANILNGRFILAIKDTGTTDERYKARFVVQGHKDRDKALIVHKAVPVRMRSIRIFMCIALLM